MKKYFLLPFIFFCSLISLAENTFPRMNIGNSYFYFINELVPILDSSLNKINIYYVKNDKDSVLSSIVQYDRLGRISSFMFLNGRNISRKSEIKYFENTDVVLGDITTDYTTKDIKLWTYVNSYEYDLNGKRIFQYSYDKDTMDIKTEKFTYKNDLLSKIYTKKTKSPKFYLSTVFSYDKQGRLSKTKELYQDFQVLGNILKYKYDVSEVKEYREKEDGKVLLNSKEYKDGLLVKYKDFSEKHSETIKGTNSTLIFSSDSYDVTYFYDNKKLIEVQIKRSNNSIDKFRLYYILK